MFWKKNQCKHAPKMKRKERKAIDASAKKWAAAAARYEARKDQ